MVAPLPPLPNLPPPLRQPAPAVSAGATHLLPPPATLPLPHPSTAAAADPLSRREIRVFISSTFRDMQEERELLVKKVFPELRRICDERFVSFTEVDLRWGITEEAAAEGKVLPICLEEIHNCRPYFIGMLGERYGWVPDTVPPEVLKDEPWIQEHEGSISVTELEILHGVLNNPEMDGHSFFYFRDPAYSAEKGADFLTENPHSAAKLAALKEAIRQSGRPLLDSYKTPEELAAAIRQQFLELIDQLYPKAEVPDPLDQEAIGHRTYARRKLLAYVDRPTHSLAIVDFVAAPSDGKGLVITGDSGGGKTALLAAYATSSFSTRTSTFLFEHYFGATSASASVPGFLHRLLGELKRRADIPDDIPSTWEKMAEALPLWLAQTVGKIPRIILVLDALNQIEGEPAHRNLSWLPRFFPGHVRVLTSSLSGPALDTLRDRGWAEHPLPLANEEERGRMLNTFFELYKKTLHPALRSQIIQAPGAANPLFLRTVLEELRQFGSFSKLPDQVAAYLTATNPVELFRQVIRRWQTDFHGGRDVVDRSLRHLWAARQGLGESEWLDLLADGHGVMDRQTWRPLFLALATHLVQRSGLWALGHDYLTQAIEAELLSTAEAKKQAHLAVADYFERHEVQQEMTPRKAAEWPFQLHAAEAWERLESCLIDIDLFLTLYNKKTKWELTGYWLPLRERGRDMGACYTAAYDRWSAAPAHDGDHLVPAQFGVFLLDNGLYPLAEPLLRHALVASERALGADHPDALTSINNLAGLLNEKGDYAGAQPLFERALKASERLLGAEHIQTLGSVNNLAELMRNKGNYAGALPLYERALEASERVLGAEHPDTLMSVNNLAILLKSKGDYAEAQSLYERALEARERVLGAEHPQTLVSVNSLAILLGSTGDYAGAQRLFDRALEARERVLGAEHPQTLVSLNNLAEMLRSKGDYAGAQPFYERALETSERVLGAEHPSTLMILNNLAALLKSKGDHAGAQRLYERAFDASERVLGAEHPQTMLIVNNLAGSLHRKGDYAGAQPLYERALKGREQVLGTEHPDTLASVHNLAALLESKGDYTEAQRLFERALEGLLKISQATQRSHPNLETFIGNYAGCLANLGRSPEQIQNTLEEMGRRYGMSLK